MENRLDSVSPDLARFFREANSIRRRKAVSASCEQAVADTSLQGADVDVALALIRSGGASQGDSATRLRLHSEALDEAYFDLADGADSIPDAALSIFRRARAASALAFAVSGVDDTLGEALYESLMAVGDQALALQRASEALAGR